MQRRMLNHLITLALLLVVIFLLFPGSRDGVHNAPPPEAFSERENYIWVWSVESSQVLIEPNTVVAWGLGWESGSRTALENLRDGLEFEFYINDRRVEDPDRYLALRSARIDRTDRVWQLSFLYEGPTLPPGEHVWAIRLGGSVRPMEFSGVIYVLPGQ